MPWRTRAEAGRLCAAMPMRRRMQQPVLACAAGHDASLRADQKVPPAPTPDARRDSQRAERHDADPRPQRTASHFLGKDKNMRHSDSMDQPRAHLVGAHVPQQISGRLLTGSIVAVLAIWAALNDVLPEIAPNACPAPAHPIKQ
jgi:hypothetical protein